ncbi:nickel pincer cofactor biosynthesis protein LarC [Catenulispora rubra]|uniref:nickel pincer cofactor biosynthesis protein LarC n=1 Tax=Catenulispora rubra TaxID=280293 RepID=UPI002B27768D|nr:nickel pincer cofactor biosynthesis protein LarC [Catenulispora rubra]
MSDGRAASTDTQLLAAHLDCTLGVAGDMLLGALVGAGARPEAITAAIDSMGIEGIAVRFDDARRAGFACKRAEVTVPAEPDVERTLSDVLAVVRGTVLPPRAMRYAERVFTLLAEAEATVHGVTPDEIHFHEVGAFDALADVVGCAAALSDLGLLEDGVVVHCSAFAAGSGTVRSQHGRLPVPAPAVLELARSAGIGLTRSDLAGERTTPTGAALVAALAVPAPMPEMTVTAVGCGGGTRDSSDGPNITRVLLGRHAGGATLGTEEIVLVESTVDDLDPRLWPSVLRAVRQAGAWDCWTTPTIGRDGRPGQTVTAVCGEQTRRAVIEAILLHTCTLGVRWSPWQRVTLPRRSVRVAVGEPGARHEITVKVAELAGRVITAQPELAEAEQIAAILGRSVRSVCEEAAAAYRTAAPPPGA